MTRSSLTSTFARLTPVIFAVLVAMPFSLLAQEPGATDAAAAGGAPAAPEPSPAASDSSADAGDFDVFVAKAEAVLDAFDTAANISLAAAAIALVAALVGLMPIARRWPGAPILQWFAVLTFVCSAQQAALFVTTSKAATDLASELMLSNANPVVGVRVYSLEHSPYFDAPYRKQQLEAAAKRAADKLPIVERFNRFAEQYRLHVWFPMQCLRFGLATLVASAIVLACVTLISRREVRN